MKPHTRLLLALVAGALAGVLLHPLATDPTLAAISTHVLRPIGQIFLRTIFMVVVPLVVSALIIGVYELGQERNLPGVVTRTLGYTVVLSTAAVLIGLLLANLLQPGVGIGLAPASSATGALQANAAAAQSFSDVIIGLIPRNPLDSAVRALDGEMLPLMVFSVIFGVAITRMSGGVEERALLISLLDQVFGASMLVVGFAMKLAPVAVFAIVFNTALAQGAEVFRSLLVYVGTVVGGLLLQQFMTYGVVLRAAGHSPVQFFLACRDVLLYAFSTASSNATLPLSLRTAEHGLGIPGRVARFVLTVGATANQNGTALFEGVTVLFLAQAYGLDLTLTQQVRVMLMSVVAGIGTAGVPGGSLPMVMVVAQSVGVPAEGIGLILGVDRFLDMCRSAVNVGGDLVIATLVGGPSKANT
jgi:DAACS family dicarboxylate/amino acid:cation (Na+ or H+) symporter